MKESNLSFTEGFLGIQAAQARSQNSPMLAFDWDKAATIIKDEFSRHPDLVAEAGLQGDWNYTGGVIFENGLPTNSEYTYLASNWAMPTMILSWDNGEQREIECSVIIDGNNSRFTSGSKWDESSLKTLGLQLAKGGESL